MTYVITQNCCKDATCVAACPVNCIGPVPGTGDYDEQPMLHIDPEVCIDCGACADACPVDAAVPADVLSDAERVYAELNAGYFRHAPAQAGAGSGDRPLFHDWG